MKCARCGSPRATNHWELTACADGGKRRSKYLCDHHDAELNEIAMTFLGIRDAQKKASAYRGASLAAQPAAGDVVEALTESEKDVALGQAVEFAEYVERQAKGTMREAAKRFLSLPYSQEIAKRLAPKGGEDGRG